MLERKLKTGKQVHWPHHRHGWTYVIGGIQKHLDNSNGVEFDGFLDKSIHKGHKFTDFVGFFHNVPYHPKTYDVSYCLDSLITSESWKRSEPYCRGIFVLCKYTAAFIRSILKNVPVEYFKHPVDLDVIQFNFDDFVCKKNIFMFGNWMRRYTPFRDLKTSLKKKAVIPGTWVQKQFVSTYTSSDVSLSAWMPHKQYDAVLASSIVFLNLYDVAACNTILDCIASSTPLLLNKLPAAVEYLGQDYPFFYESFSEAEEKVENLDLIYQTHLYLRNMDKHDLELDFFIGSMANSDTYKSLPTIDKETNRVTML